MTRIWVGEAAGPLLLLPDSLLPEWSGIDVPEFRTVVATFRWNAEEPRACDYDAACDVEAEAQAIAVAHGEGLVLSGGLRPTTWLARPWGGYVVRWEYAEDEPSVERALRTIPEDLTWEATGEFHVTSSPLTLFNSAEPGMDIVMPRLELELEPGVYAVRCALHEPDEETRLLLVALHRTST